MGVCAIRIDERLIHGQVATLWQGSWNCNRIMVIDTKSANDPMLKSVLKIACPTGVRLSVLEPDTAAANLQSGKYGKERITIVTTTPGNLLRLIDHLDTLRRLEPEGLAGYIAAACRHTAYNAVRDSSRHPWLPLDGGPEVPDERQEVEDRVLRRLELDALAQVWPRLDENTRWLLEARYILDYSDGELARELGVKPDSVRMALTRARRKARRLIENQHSKENV